jgi:hypothetical protein
MSSRNRKPARTARRLLKVASLGLAGLVAGLLSGCSTSDIAAHLTSNKDAGETLTATRRLENLDYRRTPEIRRAPTLHRHQPMPAQSSSTAAYALVGQIDAVGHHYTPRFTGQ